MAASAAGAMQCCHVHHFVYEVPPGDPTPHAVTLTGSFDQWARSIAMRPAPAPVGAPGRVWLAAVPLPWADQHRVHTFKFIVDGVHWRTCAAYPTATDPHGNVNNKWCVANPDPAVPYLLASQCPTPSSTRPHSRIPSAEHTSPTVAHRVAFFESAGGERTATTTRTSSPGPAMVYRDDSPAAAAQDRLLAAIMDAAPSDPRYYSNSADLSIRGLDLSAPSLDDALHPHPHPGAGGIARSKTWSEGIAAAAAADESPIASQPGGNHDDDDRDGDVGYYNRMSLFVSDGSLRLTAEQEELHDVPPAAIAESATNNDYAASLATDTASLATGDYGLRATEVSSAAVARDPSAASDNDDGQEPHVATGDGGPLHADSPPPAAAELDSAKPHPALHASDSAMSLNPDSADAEVDDITESDNDTKNRFSMGDPLFLSIPTATATAASSSGSLLLGDLVQSPMQIDSAAASTFTSSSHISGSASTCSHSDHLAFDALAHGEPVTPPPALSCAHPEAAPSVPVSAGWKSLVMLRPHTAPVHAPVIVAPSTSVAVPAPAPTQRMSSAGEAGASANAKPAKPHHSLKRLLMSAMRGRGSMAE
ncbi:hypothetical protein H9P43_006202 [Blastocladiella emersonii ATCC 22665]|nr:hypothetical protein H9P43_006202 [Blastocladiella emersonii ATCC 22665]